MLGRTCSVSYTHLANCFEREICPLACEKCYWSAHICCFLNCWNYYWMYTVANIANSCSTAQSFTREFVYFVNNLKLIMMKFNTDTLLQRRTIRKYTDQDVAAELLDEIIKEGCRTSTTGNMQVYSIIITRDKHVRQDLLPLHFNQKMITEAPVVLTFCADFNRFSRCLLYTSRCV